MRELVRHMRGWREPFAVATVVATGGNTPRPTGTALACDADGAVFGAVSGGCVEAEVYRLCQEALAGAAPTTAAFGYLPDDPVALGLSCDGTMEVFVQRVDPATDAAFAATVAAVAAGQAVAHARVVRGPADLLGAGIAIGSHGTPPVGMFGGADPLLERRVVATAREMLAAGASGCRTFPRAGDAEPVAVFVETHSAPPRLLIFGAVDFAAALAEVGALLGYRVTVCDARPLFAEAARFPAAAEVVADWPHRYLRRTPTGPDTVICSLTHDPKFDVPLLVEALRRPAAYVGALGSRGSARRRAALLRAEGVTEAALARLRAPIGLDLGGRGPHETAVAIMAEVLAVRHGGTGRPLTDVAGPIHRRAALA